MLARKNPSVDIDQEIAFAAARDDRWAQEYKSHAKEQWFAPLCRSRWHLPFSVVFDLGVMLMKPGVHLASGSGVSDRYVALLRKIGTDEHFLVCSSAISTALSESKDAAIRTAIQAMTRHIRNQIPATEKGTLDWQEKLAKRLDKSLQDRQAGMWIGSIDLITVRASTRLVRGARVLDYELLDQCISKWNPVPDHVLQTRKSPTRREGARDISRRQGDIIGYTGVRPRLPTDNLMEILPSEWTLLRENKLLGLDKVLNRSTLVHAKESPQDLIPELQVFVAFILDEDQSLISASKVKSQAATYMSKALAHRMILDAARQVPFDKMGVHIAVYVKDFDLREHGPKWLDSSSKTCKACFDLQMFARAGCRMGAIGPVLAFDELVPRYFSYSYLESGDFEPMEGLWPNLSDDPYTTLSEAATAVSTYSSVLVVVCSSAERWSAVLPGGSVLLRPVDIGRPTVLLVETFASDKERKFRCGVFQNLSEAEIGRSAQMNTGIDFNVRNAFLDMLLGPVQTRADSTTPIVVDL